MASKDSIVVKYFTPISCAVIGVGTVGISNYYRSRPYLAGLQRHIALGLVGALIGVYLDNFLAKKWMKRDAIIKHYIELHPEDFKDERRKYKEIFSEWYPLR